MHGHGGGVGVALGFALLRLILFGTVTMVVCWAFVRAIGSEVDRRRLVTATAALGGVTSLLVADASWLPAPAAVAVIVCLAAPPMLRTPPPLLALCVVMAVVLATGAVVVAFHGPPLAATHVVLIAGFAGLAWSALCPPTAVVRLMGVGMALALLASLGGVLLSGHLATPLPGRPLLTKVGATAMPVLVAPNRPGWNLVHVPDEPVLVGNAEAALVPATARPAATGRWALVWLAEGRGTLWLDHAGERLTIPVDTGREPWTGPDVRGPDGPEYAAAVLGAVLTGRTGEVAWPSSALGAEDAGSVRELLRSLAGREVALVTDDSPRSAEAAEVARDEAARAGVAIAPVTDDPPRPTEAAREAARAGPAAEVVVLTGWVDAARHPGPAHLAPWLSTPSLLARPGATAAPSRHDPTSPQARHYRAALADAFPGEAPSQPGLAAWLTRQG